RVVDIAITRHDIANVYFDLYRHRKCDLPDFNLVQGLDFAKLYPGLNLKDLSPIVSSLRMKKDEEEVKLTKKAIEITKDSLLHVLRKLHPGMKEYQVQAEFEYMIHMLGAEHTAFNTIAGSGINGTMMHYETNRCTAEDGSLILLDLGARYEGYNADITRTYPVNGKYTERQKQFYDIVLHANREIAKYAKPGLTLKDLNDKTKELLAEGMIKLGKIKDASEIGKYYMHSVSHQLGIDVHDVNGPGKDKLEPGMIISDEPGLYIDEEAIGIRIEDDLLITEDGCVCLSEDIIRTTEEIEEYMRNNKE
ncbi:MAG: M24 family metallopeptidase, partial [Lachnospiraceae bacterium]|nr:M24 family metallopeptidase [Lachnospiraceae bacterium]